MRYIISIGAGKNQIPLIKNLYYSGYKIIGFDLNERAPGRQYCEYFKSISTWSFTEAIEWLEQLELNYEGVGCFSCGNALITQQVICNYFELPGKINERSYSSTHNKKLLRKVLEQNGLSTINEWNLKDINESQIHDGVVYILKPSSETNSSEGVIKVIGSELKRNFKINTHQDMIIQEYLWGVEFRVSVLVSESQAVFLGCLSRECYGETLYTARFRPIFTELDWCNTIVNRLINIFRINNGVLKLDIIKNHDRVEIIELDFGICGDYFETHISPFCLDYNFISNYIKVITNDPIREICIGGKQGKYSCFDYIYFANCNNYKIDYRILKKIISHYIDDFMLIETKEDQSILTKPKSNQDNIAAILHNRPDITNAELNQLINQHLV